MNYRSTKMFTGIPSPGKYMADIGRTTIPALSSLKDVEILLLCYSISCAVIYLIGFLFKRFGPSDEPQQERLAKTIRDQINEAKEEEISALRSEIDTFSNLVQVQRELIVKLTIEVENQMKDAEKFDQLQRSCEVLNMEKNDTLNDFVDTRLKSECRGIEISKLSDALKVKQSKINEFSAENYKLHGMIKVHEESSTDLKQKYEVSIGMLKKFKDHCDRLSFQVHQNEDFEAQFSQLTSTVENLRAELKGKSEQLKKREEESFSLCDQLDKMMSMMSDKDKKIKRFESENSSLKETIRILETDIRKYEILSVQSDKTINSLEVQVDNSEGMKTMLENQWILDERNYIAKIRILKETIMKRQPSNSNLDLPPLDDLSVNSDGDKLEIVKKAG